MQPLIESAYEVELSYDKKGTEYGCDLTENKGK